MFHTCIPKKIVRFIKDGKYFVILLIGYLSILEYLATGDGVVAEGVLLALGAGIIVRSGHMWSANTLT